MKAIDWVSEVAAKLGGKPGGKDVMASTNGDKVDQVQVAMDIATKFAKMKLD